MKKMDSLRNFSTCIWCMLLVCIALPEVVYAKVKNLNVTIMSGTSHGSTLRGDERQYQYMSCDGYVWITADANGNTQVYINDDHFSKNANDLVILSSEEIANKNSGSESASSCSWNDFELHIEAASSGSSINVKMDGGRMGKLILGGGDITVGDVNMEITGGTLDRFVFDGEITGSCNISLKNCTVTGQYGPTCPSSMPMDKMTISIDESVNFSNPRFIYEDLLPLKVRGANLVAPFTPNSDNVYEIHDTNDFYWFEAFVDDGYTDIDAKLMSDISIADYTMIGSQEHPYSGVFDGNGHTISGLKLDYYVGEMTVNDQKTEYAGLFGYVKGTSSKWAEIKNLTVEGRINHGYWYVRSTTYFIAGGVVAIADQYVKVSDVVSDVTINVDPGKNLIVKTHVGGIVGTTEIGTQTGPLYLDRCTFKGAISQSGHDACAGIVGCIYSGHIWDCVNAGTVTNIGCIENSWVSGIVGYASNSSSSNFTMKRCLNVGEISAYNDNNNCLSACYAIGRMEHCPSGAFEKLYYKSGSASAVKTGSATINSSDIVAVSDAQLSSGEVAWKLNGSTSSTTTWRQNIGSDAYPTPDYKKNIVSYSNSSYTSSLTMDGDYYLIYSVADLNKFRSMVNGGQTGINAKLMADIVDNQYVLDGENALNGTPSNTWIPIGNSSNKFAGTFDGQGHTISGLYFNYSSTSNVGLFGYTTSDAKIKNIILRDSYIAGSDYVGGICGYIQGTISNCANFATIKGHSGSASAGGICGRNSSGTVENCYNAGKIDASGSYASSLGESASGSFNNCYYLEGTHTKAVAMGTSSTVYEITADQLRSGEIAYKLNGTQSSLAWRQTIGSDSYPVLDATHKVVHRCYDNCASTTPYYNNVGNGHPDQGHKYVDGLCCYCNAPQADYMTATNGYYQIGNAKQLVWFAAYVNAGNASVNAKLTADLNMTGTKFVPIGTEAHPYSGTFNGQGHSVTLSINGNTLTYQGIIGCTSGTTTVTDLIMKGSVSCLQYAGLVGGSTGGTLTISRCANYANVSTSTTGSGNASGIYGVNMNNSTTLKIENCLNAGTIDGKEAGGISGWIGSGTVVNCLNYGKVTGTSADAFVRKNNGTITNSYCYKPSGTVTSLTGATETTLTDLSSGKITYALNGKSSSTTTWRQTLGTDSYPVLDNTHGVVYNTYADCSSNVPYSNANNGHTTQGHNHVDGICSYCSNVKADYMTATNGYYEIGNVKQLVWFAAYVNAGNQTVKAKLTADIDLASVANWTPIGLFDDYGATKQFKGEFDGQGHVVKNVKVSRADGFECGFFSRTESATVKNLGIVNATITNSYNGTRGDYTGVRCGALGGELHLSTITNCYTAGTITITNAGNPQKGGLAGEGYKSNFTNCYSTYEGALANNVVNELNNCYTPSSDDFATNLASGKLCFLLNNNTTDWHQTIGTDAYPVLDKSHKVVYNYYANCSETTPSVYNNESTGRTQQGHSWDEGTITTQPTCIATGVRTFTCAFNCGTPKTEVVAIAGHNEVAIPAVEPTCVLAGSKDGKKCSVCHDTLVVPTVVPAKGHTEETLAAVNPTCTETGLTEGKKCSVCDSTLVAQTVVAAKGHTPGEVDYNYNKHWYTCVECWSLCADKENHNHNAEDGSCSVCGVDEPEAEEGYYLIGNCKQLYWMKTFIDDREENHYDASFKLTNDIVVNENLLNAKGGLSRDESDLMVWQPVYETYWGTFDGQGHSIRGLFCKNPNGKAGLFSETDYANISNLEISDSYFEGVIAGAISAISDEATKVNNCASHSTICGNVIGGLVGEGNVKISNSISTCNFVAKPELEGEENYVGLIAGHLVPPSVSGYDESCDNILTNCFYATDSVYTAFGVASPFVDYDWENQKDILYAALDTLRVHKKPLSAFKSGEVAYLLNQSYNDSTKVWTNDEETPAWRQNLLGRHADAFPVPNPSHKRVVKVAEGKSYSYTVKAGKQFGTFCYDVDVALPDSMSAFHTVYVDDNKIFGMIVNDGFVPAGTPVILRKKTSENNVTISFSGVYANAMRQLGDTCNSGQLVGLLKVVENQKLPQGGDPNFTYTMQTIGGVQNFYLINTPNFKATQYRCYLDTGLGQNSFQMQAAMNRGECLFEGEETGFQELLAEDEAPAPTYNLQGQRAQRMDRGGIYVQNNKRSMIK